jgi:hypothetical protein
MSSKKIFMIFILVIILSRTINSNSGRLYQSGTFLGQFEFQSSERKDSSVQEKAKYVYVGAKTCVGKCHNNSELGYQYIIWKNSNHSKSFINLASERAIVYAKKANIKEIPQKSSICLKCHTTGWGLDPSSFSDTYTKEDGVTCEACHKDEFKSMTLWKGKHTVNSKDLQPDEKTCLKCHNNSVHKMRKFNYRTELKKIAHPIPKQIDILSLN